VSTPQKKMKKKLTYPFSGWLLTVRRIPEPAEQGPRA
jgi:hypothetical protein